MEENGAKNGRKPFDLFEILDTFSTFAILRLKME